MKLIELKPGAEVIAKGCRYRIVEVSNLESVTAINVSTGKSKRIKIANLSAPSDQPDEVLINEDLASIDPTRLEIAQKRYKAIQPIFALSENQTVTRADMSEHASNIGVNTSTLYRWISLYRNTGNLSGLIPYERSGGRGKSRIDPKLDEILVQKIETHYLNNNRRSIERVIREVKKACKLKKLKPPHANTVRNRIAAIDERTRLGKRHGREATKKFNPIIDHFPGADWPYSVIQIDHTKVDIILVDDENRLPVGKPWITLAIDVHSRMVAGFYISFDPPGGMATGLCIANSILPKETWLARIGVEGSWPVWGTMSTIHADNAREFRGNMLKLACQIHGINLEWRPVKKPEYGGHIERLLGTFNQEIHNLPGTTFSNPFARGNYPSLKKSALTLNEFEHWLATYITQVYHQKTHSGIGRSPLQQYEIGIFGDDNKPGIGIKPRIEDERKLRLDFMPYIERSVQPYGIVIDGIHYYSDVLRSWIAAKDPSNPKKKRKFIIRRDPRDISTVYFYDPTLREYFDVPYRNTTRPSISIWEMREVRRRLQEKQVSELDEEAIFSGYEQMLKIEEEAISTTRRFRSTKARRDQQRKKQSSQILSSPKSKSSTHIPSDLPEDVQPFDDIEDLSHGY